MGESSMLSLVVVVVARRCWARSPVARVYTVYETRFHKICQYVITATLYLSAYVSTIGWAFFCAASCQHRQLGTITDSGTDVRRTVFSARINTDSLSFLAARLALFSLPPGLAWSVSFVLQNNARLYKRRRRQATRFYDSGVTIP